MKISNGETTQEMENVELVQLREDGGKYWFILREKTQAEVEAEKTQANIEYIAMMADIDLEEV